MSSADSEAELKIGKKSENVFFLKIQKTCQRMAQGKPQLKFERNLCIWFRENCDTDAGRPDAGQKSHTMSSADRVKQS